MDVDVPVRAVPHAVIQGTAAIKVMPDRGVVDSPVEWGSGALRSRGLVRLSPKPKPRAVSSTTMEMRPPQYQVELLGDDFKVHLHEGPVRPTPIDPREKVVPFS